LDAAGVVPAHELVAVRNVLLHVQERTPYSHTPQLFNLAQVPFDYDSNAPQPKVWLDFLAQLWPDDSSSVAALQEWFGYVISGDTRLHKILLIFGPIRSGKGTIGRTLTALLGERNVAGPSLSSLATNFGLQPLLGKSLAIISDARLGSGNVHQVVERLLSVSGEDTQTVDRKYKDPWTGRLSARFMIMTNELPRLGDAAGAAATRFIPLTLIESWLGREDHDLEKKLRPELPGILNWSLDGLKRLQLQGRFTVPVGSDETIESLQDVGSPVAAFVRDRCAREPDLSVWQDDLYATYRGWCLLNGHAPRNASWFGRDLRAVDPRIKMHRLESPLTQDHATELHRFRLGDRPYYYTGIGLSR
jgi:putative DNA primase/helicase